MQTKYAKFYALPLDEVLNGCSELFPYVISGKLDLSNTNSIQMYNKCLFFILEKIRLNFTKESNLIPTCGLRRSFTSVLIENVNPNKVIEIGTGAYAIMALLLAKKNIDVIATEIDEKSIISAQNTIKLNKLDQKISIIPSKGKILKIPEFKDIRADCVFSLPPYYDLNNKKHSNTFLGTDNELFSEKEGEYFSFQLIKEWVEISQNIPKLCILWKSNESFEKGLKFFENLDKNNLFSVEEFKIVAGTRSRYITIFSLTI